MNDEDFKTQLLRVMREDNAFAEAIAGQLAEQFTFSTDCGSWPCAHINITMRFGGELVADERIWLPEKD